ncbi:MULTISPECIES: hypothetical protein [unclassified Acidovorax]|uniref:hypothetical protein n=1 Tax=unclassified Acidovorax TaxID=2684926 RepID=UPI001C45FAB5|nr:MULTISPECIES: hypothetical protein [unclassified Acidovorax]MBV7428074.1 hypothetical protein [Acidovorax sp. sif0732]MBV7449331.1 hypothetical protein [Acidovorax sp. sif0715]
MQPSDIAALLEAAPLDHQRRSELANRAIEAERWPAAACGLRHAAAMAREWADKAAELANYCDTQAESGRVASTVAPSLVEITEPGTLLEQTCEPTLQSLEAGILSLAHFLGREHAVHTRRAMANVLRSQSVGA